MFDYTGQIVQATAGRDKGGFFCVVGTDPETERLLLADGNAARSLDLRQKNARHVQVQSDCRCPFDHPAIQRLKQGEPVSDRELRRALAAFKEGITLGER